MKKPARKRRLRRLISHDIAVDLGTANTLVAVAGHGIVIDEPSVVATNKKTKEILAIGDKAKKMLGKTPRGIITARPLTDGVVSDFEITELMLKHFIHRVHRRHQVLYPRPRMVIGLPSGVTEVEKRAVEEAARSAGARKTYLIEEPVAAAIGTGLPVHDAQGSMIIDIGGGTTEIAVLSLDGVVVSRSLRIAGDELTDTIQQFMRDEFNLQIGERTAEELKLDIGAVYVHADPKSMTVRGRNATTGLPQQIEISSDILRVPLSKQFRPIIEAVKLVIEEVPPELVGDIMQRGIMVAGGGGLVGGIDHLIKQETKMDVVVADNALTAVVEGAMKALTQYDVYKSALHVSQVRQ